MSQPQSGHELFEQIQQDHAELRKLLGEVHQALSRREASVDAVASLIESLTVHLEAHFQEEEATGVFDQVTAREPRLCDRASALCAEHDQLRKTAAALNQAAKSADGADWWDRLETAFHEFSKDLMRHEHEENELVQEAYEQDIGAGD